VIYADQDVVISSAMESEMLNDCTDDQGVGAQSHCLADIPCAGTAVLKGTPLCSVYADVSAKDQRFSAVLSLLNLPPLAAAISVSELIETIQTQLVVLAND
jgi:predicted ATP-grasp superfamily ATP-dependent carboligase